MCTSLPEVLITVMGIEKVIPAFRDLEVMLQLLPRSSTGERMNPYTSIWAGVHAGRRAACLPSRPARRRPHARARRPRSAATRCAASAARRASTSAPSTGRPADTPTTRRTPARSARSCSRSSTGSAAQSVVAPVRVVPVRRLRGRLSRADRHPRAARARAARRPSPRSGWTPRRRVAEAARTRVSPPRRLRAGAATGAHLPAAVRARRLDPPLSAGPAAGLGPERATFPRLPKQTFREWWESRERA